MNSVIPRVLCACYCVAFFVGCAAQPQMPYHGFSDQSSLDQKDSYVIAQSSSNGSLDPMQLAQADQRYAHDGIAYSQVEEGYYRWGQKMYEMGYRDVYYVRDLAPHAFRHDLMDVYDHDIEKGFEDAAAANKSAK